MNNPARLVRDANEESTTTFSPATQQHQRIPEEGMWRMLGAGCLIAALVVATFFPLQDAEFLNIDDDEYVTENQFVNSGLSRTNIIWAVTQSHSGHWHPVTWLSHMLDCSFFGLDARAHHLVNVGFHSIAMLLLFIALTRMTLSLWRSFFVTALVAVSPLRLESVAWVAERKDVLSMLFAAGTLLGYSWYVRRPSFMRYSAVLIPYALGLLAKPMLVSVPLLLLLLDVWPLNRLSLSLSGKGRFRLLLGEKLPLILLACAVSYLTIRSQSLAGGLKPLNEVSLEGRLTVSLVGYLTYLGKFLWPFNLGVFYPLRPYPSGLAAGAFMAMVSITLWALSARKQPYLQIGWGWFLCSLVPIIGLVQIGGQQVADRWTYLPHIGLTMAAVWCLAEWARVRGQEVLLCGMGVALVAVLAVVTHIGTTHWRTSETLFSHTLEIAPDNFFAHTNLGVAVEGRGDLKEAAHHYDEAIRLNPTYSVALNNRGAVYAREGNLPEALILFDRALATSPQFSPAKYHRGLARELMGAPVEAMVEWVAILQYEPSFERARASLQIVVQRALSQSCDMLRQGATQRETTFAAILRDQTYSWAPVRNDDQVLQGHLQEFVRCLSKT